MKRILLIDDDPDDRDTFRDALNDLETKTEYLQAVDGQEGLDMLLADGMVPPDMIFVDLNMPRVNGLEFVIRIRKISKYESTPIYMYTTSASPRERVNSTTAGATGYIVKHVRMADLRAELAQLISSQRLSA